MFNKGLMSLLQKKPDVAQDAGKEKGPGD